MGKSLNTTAAATVDRYDAGSEFVPPGPPPRRPAAPAAGDHASAGAAPAGRAPATPAPAAAPAEFTTEQLEQLRALLAPAPAAPAPALTYAAPSPNPLADVAPPAGGGAVAYVGAEPEVYHPDSGYSFVRDAFFARVEGDLEAAERFSRWQRQLNSYADVVEADRRRRGRRFGTGSAYAVDTRAGQPDIIPPGYRGDLLIEPDVPARPILSRLRSLRVTLADATPFSVPRRGAFSGVGDHTEGTAHVASGTMTTDEITVSPKAISGAYEVSRELVDSSNPAIDLLAWSSMIEEYDNDAEAYAWTRIVGAQLDKVGGTVLAALTPVTTINTAALLEAQLVAFYTNRLRPGSFAASGPEFFTAVDGFKDTTGRALYPQIGPANANGQTTVSENDYGIVVKSVPHVLSAAGGANGADQNLIIRERDILVGESAVRRFRFEEVGGPGIIKIALWAYQSVTRFQAFGARLLDLDATNP